MDSFSASAANLVSLKLVGSNTRILIFACLYTFKLGRFSSLTESVAGSTFVYTAGPFTTFLLIVATLAVFSVSLAFSAGVSTTSTSSSGIKYSPVIAKGISTGQLSVVVSVDSSSKEIYKKIKQTDKYETVCKNLKKYAKSQRGSYNVISKYIIIPEINDNTVEIDNWLKFNKDNNIGIIVIDIENSWLNRYRKEEPDKRIIDLMKYVAAKSKEMNFYRLEICDRAKYLI